jgi:ribosomal protein S21
MAVVKAQPGQSSDQLIRAFQKKVLSENILEILKEHVYHEKPSTKKKNKALERKRSKGRIFRKV